MKAARQIEFLAVFLWITVTLWVSRTRTLPAFDFFFKFIFKKSLTQRSQFIQILGILPFAFILSYLIVRLLRMKKTKIPEILCFLAVIVLLGILCAYQTIRRDDFWEIRDAFKYGFPEYIFYEYREFNGRYFSLFIKSLYQFFPPAAFINTFLFLTILLLFAGGCFLSCRIMKKPGVFDILNVGFLIAGGSIFISSNIWEVWFWGSGTFVYGTGIALIITACALMLAIEQSDENLNRKTIAAAVCIFCACGTSELNTASMCIFSFLIFAIPPLFLKRRWNRRSFLLFLFSMVLAVIILTTSGDIRDAKGLTSIHGNGMEGNGNPVAVLPEKLLLSAENLIRWFFYGKGEFALIFICTAFLAGLCTKSRQIPVKIFLISFFSLLITAVIILTINLIIDFMPSRVLAIPLTWILLAFMLSAYFAGAHVRSFISEKEDMYVLSSLIPLILFTLTGWFYLCSIGTIRDIHTAWILRDRGLRSLDVHDEAAATCAIPVPGSAQADPGEDAGSDFNIVIAYYYGFTSVTADHLCSPFD